MERQEQDPRIPQLLVSALASYSDACTMPELTPNCPYYRADPFPSCGEECREVLAAEGFGREVRTVEIDGLRMTGRALPIDVCGPAPIWDPVQTWLEQRDLEPAHQSSSTLLLRLWMALQRTQDGAAEAIFDLAAELDRRGIDAERVIRAALIPQMAGHVVTRCFAFVHFGSELVDDAETRAWVQLAERFVEQHGVDGYRSDVADSATLDNLRRGMSFFAIADRLNPVPVDLDTQESDDVAALREGVLEALRANPVLPFIMSPAFLNRVQHWLGASYNNGLAALLNAGCPAQPVFDALRTNPPSADATGMWLWERYTALSINEWETESLMLEWGHRQGDRPTLPATVINERVLDAKDLSAVVIGRLTLQSVRAPHQTLDPSEFVKAALEHLRADEPERAAAIFYALVDLNPTDGDTRNNLGFCQLPSNPQQALETLEKAARARRSNEAVCELNQCVAHILLGDPATARDILERVTTQALVDAKGAYMWRLGNTADGATAPGLELSLEEDLVSYAGYLRLRCDLA